MTDASFSDTGEHTVLGDIGGTNARFAVLNGDRLGPIEHLAVRDYMHFADALAAFWRAGRAGARFIARSSG